MRRGLALAVNETATPRTNRQLSLTTVHLCPRNYLHSILNKLSPRYWGLCPQQLGQAPGAIGYMGITNKREMYRGEHCVSPSKPISSPTSAIECEQWGQRQRGTVSNENATPLGPDIVHAKPNLEIFKRQDA